jgi:Asp-tRNA(Asn)/Glu-tRNA(Gln) amidotransferase B subunit
MKRKQALNGNNLQHFLAQNLPELPEAARQRLRRDYKLDAYTAAVIAGDPPAIHIYDQAVKTAKDNLPESQQKDAPNEVAKVLINDLFSHVREEEDHRREMQQVAGGIQPEAPYSNVSGPQLGELVSILMEGLISKTMAKNLLKILFYEEQPGVASPRQVAQERGIQLVSDPEQLRAICQETIEQFPDKLEQYRKGGKHIVKMKKFLVGKAMAHSKGNAHPERLHEALEVVLEELAPGVQ